MEPVDHGADWSGYWSTRDSSEHRFDDEDFYRTLADERLLHLGKGGSFLDFGCGAGECLRYMAPWYAESVAVDFSEPMLAAARERLATEPPAHQPEFLLADDRSVWELLRGRRFDHILASGVVQYLDRERLAAFVACATEHLAADGRILLADIPDPRLAFLFERGLLTRPCNDSVSWRSITAASARRFVRRILNKLRGRPTPTLGRAYCPEEIHEIAASAELLADFPSSMRYEYRYHAVLTRGRSHGEQNVGDRSPA